MKRMNKLAHGFHFYAEDQVRREAGKRSHTGMSKGKSLN